MADPGTPERDYIRLGGPCREHFWQFIGGRNACCQLGDDCHCSVPVHRCRACGDYDYGDNDEADQVRTRCAELGPA
jgi:hypothetical protein